MKINRIKSKVTGKQIPTANSITCGRSNPASLKCSFYELENGEVATCFTPEELHEGHSGIMHGGLSSAVLDEAMGRATLCRAVSENADVIPKYVTAEMTTKYLKPILVGKKIFVYGRVERTEGRCCFTSSEATDENGEVMATATGVYVRLEGLKDALPSREKIKQAAALTGSDPHEM